MTCTLYLFSVDDETTSNSDRIAARSHQRGTNPHCQRDLPSIEKVVLTDRSPCLSQCSLQRSHPHQSFEQHLVFRVSSKVTNSNSSMSSIGGIFLGFSGTDSDDEDVHSTVNTTVISKSPVRTPTKQTNSHPGENSSLVKTLTLPVILVSDNSNGNAAKQPVADETKSAKSKRKKSTKDRSRSPIELTLSRPSCQEAASEKASAQLFTIVVVVVVHFFSITFTEEEKILQSQRTSQIQEAR